MGRNAKLRKQRKAGTLPQDSPTPDSQSSPHYEVPAPPVPQTGPGFAQGLFEKFTAALGFRKKSTDFPLDAAQLMETAIDANQEILGAIAWEGYKKKGRGLVLIEQKQNTLKLSYLARSAFRKQFSSSEIETLNELAEHYNPETEIIPCLVMRRGDIFTSSPATTEPAPPDCHFPSEAQLD